MKKLMLNGMAALAVCAAFVSCSHDTDFEASNQEFTVENLKNEYKANFIKKYGEIDPNQSWDFTNLDVAQARTRGGAGQTTWSTIQVNNNFWSSFIDLDAPGVKGAVATAPRKNWEHALAVELYPCYAHGKGVDKDQYFHLAIVEKGKTDYRYSYIPYIDVIGNIQTKDDNWYGAGSALIHNTGRNIQAKNIYSEKKIWVAYYTWKDNFSSATKKENAEIIKKISDFEIKEYKEIKVNDHIYWCFDCNKDGDFRDLICLVKNIDPVKPTAKRYLIEDLGSSSDFDFNDIVVDVIENPNGSQKAQVRAMGGTLNFTLQIGDATATWTKGGSEITVDLNGTKETAEITKMYNTVNPIYDLVLAEFTVSGWRPADNNITVFVTKSENNVTESGNVIIKIPFSREGEVPMIIAVDPLTYWNKERVELDRDWWKYPADEEPVQYTDD